MKPMLVAITLLSFAGCNQPGDENPSATVVPAHRTAGPPIENEMPTTPKVEPLLEQAPLLFKQKQFDSVILAKAINYYIELGEKQSLIELQALSRDDFDFANGFDINERIGWVCRVLYVAKNGVPLRPPAFGGLSLPRNSICLLYTSPSPRDQRGSRMPSSA